MMLIQYDTRLYKIGYIEPYIYYSKYGTAKLSQWELDFPLSDVLKTVLQVEFC